MSYFSNNFSSFNLFYKILFIMDENIKAKKYIFKNNYSIIDSTYCLLML